MYSMLLCALIESAEVSRVEWEKFHQRRLTCRRLEAIRSMEWETIPYKFIWDDIMASPEMKRIILTQQYASLVALLPSRPDIRYVPISEDLMRVFSDFDVSELVRHLKGLLQSSPMEHE